MQRAQQIVCSALQIHFGRLIAQENENERGRSSIQVNHPIRLLDYVISQPESIDCVIITRL